MIHRVVLAVTAPLAFARRAVAAMLALSCPVNQVTPGAFFGDSPYPYNISTRIVAVTGSVCSTPAMG